MRERSFRNKREKLACPFRFHDIDAFKKISVLSGGERSRLFLCFFSRKSGYPLSGRADQSSGHRFARNSRGCFTRLQRRDLAVSHDRYFIDKCASRILGFVDKTARIFSSFSEYRNANSLSSVKSNTGEIKVPPVTSNAPFPPDSSDQKLRGRDRARERREDALRKERLRELETLIESLEIEQRKLEQSFSNKSSHEDYQQYARNTEVLQALFDEYILLGSESEKAPAD